MNLQKKKKDLDVVLISKMVRYIHRKRTYAQSSRG